MNQIESIQQNIHHMRVELSRARKVVIVNELQKLHIEGAIQYYLDELKDLNLSLNFAIKQG